MNDTTIIFDGIKQEMRGLRLMTLQNRLVLDQLTASQGGVCVIVGDSCCTYVPDNDADGHLIDQGIKNITKAVVEMTIRERNRDDWDWSLSFSSLFQKYQTLANFNRYNYFMHSGFALLMALYYGYDSPCIEIIFKCDYERLPCCPGKTRRQGDHEPECNVKSEIKTCSDRTGALD